MTSDAFRRTEQGFAIDNEERLQAVENRNRRSLGTPRGDTVARNAYFGTPTTDEDRAQLANAQVRWFNTERGWEESYYATTGIAGLTARGLVAGVASGWFPVGPGGPRMFLVPSAQQSLSTGLYFTNWAAPGTGLSWRNGGPGFLDLAGGVPWVRLAGRYDTTVRLGIQAGAGAAALYLSQNDTAGVQVAIPDQDAVVLNGTYGMIYKLSRLDLLMTQDTSVRVYAASVGSAIFAPSANSGISSSGSYEITYAGPPLVNQ